MAKDPELLAHQQWLGYLQPVGLVVSPPALLQAQAHVNANIAAEHQRFLPHVKEVLAVGRREPLIAIKDLRALLLDVFGWQPGDLIEAGDPRAARLEVVLTDYHETLRPTFAVPDDMRADPPTWLLLIHELPLGMPLDEVLAPEGHHWQATPQARFERLLRETQVPIGLLANGTHLRLVYAPRGETTGHLTFPVQAMTEVAGRPIFSALLMLLGADRLFSLPDKQRLPAILAESRKYQNTVSTELARQVLAALYELLRGFQSADDLRKGELLREILEREPDKVYAGLLTVLMRLVFLLFAEDRGLMSEDEVYVKHYSVTGLFERLRADAGRYPDTMGLRYGAWAQLLVLFRMVYRGAHRGPLELPARHGYLFDPDRYPFLEGRPPGSRHQPGERLTPPLVADGVVFRVLQNLFVLDGERISYRSLDVEQIGSVYETIMGFRLEKARGRSIAIKPAKAHGAPVTIDLEALLQVPGKDRGKWLKEQTGQRITGAALNALKAAQTPEALVAALERKVARDLTPNIVPPGGVVLQPSAERRRSGMHYTPRSLTGPIVSKALEPVLRGLGNSPKHTDLLALKVCDPAMGSGAFLVETCRQLAEEVVKAWHAHGRIPVLPPDEDELLLARRLVAVRCLYGVDKNPMATDLAKLSLWLATLAKQHPFTFLDHALRCGDSLGGCDSSTDLHTGLKAGDPLVGVTLEQIRKFDWDRKQPHNLARDLFDEAIRTAIRLREEIGERGEYVNADDLQVMLDKAENAVNDIRVLGDLLVAVFFSSTKPKDREAKRKEVWGKTLAWLDSRSNDQELKAFAGTLRHLSHPLRPFHWELEFPEVFARLYGGFDCIVGNPPFAGKNTILAGHPEGYLDWLKAIHEESHGNADLVAHFYRRAFNLLRPGGTFGLIATNTIAQGDTRTTGLRWICTHGGTIYAARRRYKWPGQAAVVVSVVHVVKGAMTGQCLLDGKDVPLITAYLFHDGGHENPVALKANENKSFIGSYVLGMGFTFDDTDREEVASPIALMHELIAKDRRNAERIFPYIGGEEVNDSPTHAHHRYVINFGEMTEEEARRWPDLMRIVEEKVKPQRMRDKREIYRRHWWLFAEKRADLQVAIRGLERVLVCSRIGNAFAFTFLPKGMVCNEKTVVFPFSGCAPFCTIQSRVHETWARFFSSTLKDDLQYTPSACFETFPFPEGFETHPWLEAAGKEYFEFRAALMVRNNEGLTKTYNRFHDPHERSADILRLRELHAAMDRAVLNAYGWTDLKPACDFLLDYEEEEDEKEIGGRQRKRPWRYRWSDDFRDELLAKLLELNKQRAEREALAGTTGPQAKKPGRRKPKAKEEGPTLF